MGMVEARLRIKYPELKSKNLKLSVQHALDCSFYNQGCEGGYPFLVSKFSNEFELVDEKCSPYTGEDGACDKCDIDSLDNI